MGRENVPTMQDESFTEVIFDSYLTLELPAVLEEVAAHALSLPGREKVLAAEPVDDLETIRSRLDLVSELREMIDLYGPQGLAGLIPMEGLLHRLESPGTVLDAEEILAVGDLLGICETVRNRLESLDERFGLLRLRAARIEPLGMLKNQIGRVFDEHGTVRSTASAKLWNIREGIRSLRQRVNKRLEGIVRDRDLARIIQEDYVTMRNDRYVILLRPEFKGLLDGIVHDHSRSGASVYVEPLDVVALNNETASLMDEEREEIRNILKGLTEEIRYVREELRADYEALASLDAYQARSLYAKATSSICPELIDDGFRIFGGRHPLLLAAGEGEVVPMDVIQDADTTVTVISGANMGGKTVALKIAGLFPLMTRCGIMIPAREGTQVHPFPRIMADIGDEQDIRSRVSSFSGHMLKIKTIMDNAGPGDLVLLDELGGATDPDEGSALAMAIVDELTTRNVRVVVTTHLIQLKAYALTRADVKNVSVEFHPETLRPTYRLIYDLPGESHAIETAEHVGMDSRVLAAARRYADKASGGSLRLIETLRNKLSEVEELRARLDAQQRLLSEEVETTRAGRAQVVEAFRSEAREMMRRAEKQIADLQQSLKEGRVKPGPKARESLQEIRSEVVEQLGIPLEKQAPDLKVGARVKVKSLGRVGTVRSVPDKGRVEIVAGNVTIRADSEDVIPLEDAPEEKSSSKNEQIRVDMPLATPQWQVNVIGLRVDEALPIVEKALDQAVLGGLTSVTIIHGKGTGRLKSAIRTYLSEHPLVRGFRSEESRGGGAGVTVAELVSGE